jgi:protein-S-isoprenylcysteine O-methyltransferase Ste14
LPFGIDRISCPAQGCRSLQISVTPASWPAVEWTSRSTPHSTPIGKILKNRQAGNDREPCLLRARILLEHGQRETPVLVQKDGGGLEITLLWKILVYGWVAAEILIGIATRTRSSGGKVKDRGSLVLIWVTIFLAIFAGEWVRAQTAPNIFGGASWLPVAAILLLIAGLAIRATAIFSLGKAFSPNVAIRDNQTIYRGGLYRWLRHPAYTGSLLSFLAVGIDTRNWITLIVIVAPITAAFLYRIHVEEAALNEAFGAEYATYSQQTWRLIPGIY